MRRTFGAWLVLAVTSFGGCSGAAFSSNPSSNAESGNGGEAGASTASAGASTASAGAQASAGGAAGFTNQAPGGDSTSSASGDGGDGPANGCPCAAPTPTCEAGRCVVRGPKMVKASTFYVDSTEVTVANYAAFLKAKTADTSQQPHACEWNISFEPLPSPTAPEPVSDNPVTNVDYCDAAAYCAWADKRLCGKLSGGPVAFADLASAAQSQWFAACGGPAGQLYPYGNEHKNGVCNDASGAGKVVAAGSSAACTGFYAGLSDMLGNVAEWVDACDAENGAIDGCETIGGSFEDMPLCNSSSLKHRSEQLPTVGFRCCSQ
jgi:formylglycine-generating enzyme required for sulfatase activity